MADRAKRARVLTLIVVTLVFGVLYTIVPAEAHNTWVGGYRKWPWKAGVDRALTTLPGQCPHCPGMESSSAWKAIDVAMNYETVYAVVRGSLRYEPSGGKAGI